MKKILMIIGIILFLLFVIGLVQNYLNTPLRGCQKNGHNFTSPGGTHYVGYNCSGEEKYIVH